MVNLTLWYLALWEKLRIILHYGKILNSALWFFIMYQLSLNTLVVSKHQQASRYVEHEIVVLREITLVYICTTQIQRHADI